MIRKSKNGRTYRKQPVDERGRKVHSEYIFELHTEQEVIHSLVGYDGPFSTRYRAGV